MDQRNRRFIDESVCTSTTIPITEELSCRILFGNVPRRKKRKKKERGVKEEREKEFRRKIRRLSWPPQTKLCQFFFHPSFARVSCSKWNSTVLWCFPFNVQFKIRIRFSRCSIPRFRGVSNSVPRYDPLSGCVHCKIFFSLIDSENVERHFDRLGQLRETIASN